MRHSFVDDTIGGRALISPYQAGSFSSQYPRQNEAISLGVAPPTVPWVDTYGYTGIFTATDVLTHASSLRAVSVHYYQRENNSLTPVRFDQ